MPGNVVDLKEHLKDFSLPGAKFSLSARKVNPYLDMRTYLKLHYPYVGAANIDSVFGFVLFPSLLYGGRRYHSKHVLTNLHLVQLKELGIGLSLNLTNHYFDDTLYEQSRPLLERHHAEGNSITCTSNRLAKRIKQDFPHYLVRASILKKLNTSEKIERALDVYDQVVLPMEKNDDDALLESLPHKERIMLFANATCGYACPDRTCWLNVSQMNQGRKETADCTKTAAERQAFGKAFFDAGKFHRMGYRHFKLTPVFASPHTEEVAKHFSARTPAAALLERHMHKPAFYLCSFPKSGRTWLRYLLAHYLNLRFRLGLPIDFRTFFQLSPNNSLEQETGLGTYDYYDDPRFPLLLASHDTYTREKFSGKKIIFLLRSPLDTVVSNYFQHARAFTEKRAWKGTFKDFIRSDKGIAAYCAYLNSWADFIDGNRSAHVLSYEAMHRDITGSVRQVLEFMGIPIEAGNLAEAISLSSFDAMMEMETRTRIPDPNFNFSADDADSARIRKGKVGGYLDYLDEEDISYVHGYCSEHLSPMSRKLIEQLETSGRESLAST